MAPRIEAPAFAKSSSAPYPTSTTCPSIPPAGVAGDHPADFSRTGNFTGPSNSSLVSPSLHVTGSMYFSVCTSTPAARNAARPHSTALAISGDPVTRPPISSVSRRRFSSSGDEPITIGKIFDAASAHDDGSVVEQPALPGALCAVLNGSFFAGGSCPCAGGRHATKQKSRKGRSIVRHSIRWLSFLEILM